MDSNLNKLSNKNRYEFARLQQVRRVILLALDSLIKEAGNKPALQTLYKKIRLNVQELPINIKPGNTLAENNGFATFGENEKRIVYKGGFPTLESSIRIPENHLFNGTNIRWEGLMTLLHEYSHVVLSNIEKNFAYGLSKGRLNGNLIDEFFADILSARIAKKMEIPRKIIREHYLPRIGVYGGFPIHEVVEGRFSPEREEGRERIRDIKPYREPLFPEIKEKRSFMPHKFRPISNIRDIAEGLRKSGIRI